MLRRFGLVVCWLATCGIALAGSEERPDRIRILYAGNPGSDRERDYVGFLKKTFAQVDTVDYRAFREKMAEGHDVVIFDWTSIYPRDKAGRMLDLTSTNSDMNYPEPPPHPSYDYSRPTILIGGPGERAVRPLQLKIDWGCLCLNHHAHGMKTEHPIFKEPFPVDIRLEEIPTPEAYRLTSDGKPVGPTIQAWRIQTPRFYDPDPGLVSRGDEFEEAPDAEVISSGLNGKGPEMVALGRHGNYFLWGFASPPSEMTPEARKCFLNVVCYIRKFDGRKPVVRKPDQGIVTRKRVHHSAEFARIVLDPEGLRKSYSAYASYAPERYKMFRDMELRVFRKHFPAQLNDRGASDPNAYLAWVKANDRWLIPGAYDEDDGIRAIAVDEDLKALGMGNRDIATLDACVAMLVDGDSSGRALRVLKRYTGRDFADAKGWKAWLDAHRDRLVFTEVGGFRFVVADSPGETRPADDQRLPLSPPGPSRKLFEPVKLSASVEPSVASAGQVVTVLFRLGIAPRWHVATKAGTAGPEVPLSLELALPNGLEPEGEWTLPKPTFDAEGHGRYEGKVELRHKVRVTAAAHGKTEITPSAYFQACDPSSCRPATLKSLHVTFEVATP